MSAFMIGMILSGCESSIPESWGTPNIEYLELVDMPPCWYGICPGQTTPKEAEQILQSLPIGGKNGIEKTETEKSITLLLDDQRFEGGKTVVKFDNLEQMVESIEVFPWKNELTMGQVVDLLGAPKEVIVTTQGSGGHSAANFASYTIWYPELGLAVESGIYDVGVYPTIDEVILHPSLAVFQLEYLQKEKGKEHLVDNLLMKLLPLQRPADKKELESFFYLWPGFGNSVPSFLDLERYGIGLGSDEEK